MLRFDLVDLRLFVNIVDGGSITAGARASYLSPASASARLAAMEDSLGHKLLERGKGRVRPTAPGITLLSHARAVLAQVDQLRSEMGAFGSGRAATIRMLYNTTFASELLPALLVPFLAEQPAVAIESEERQSVDIVRMVASGNWHLGIVSDAVAPLSLETLPLAPDPLVAIAPHGHPLAHAGERGAVAFAACLEHDFVGLAGDSALFQHLAGHAAALAQHLKVRISVRGMEGVCQLVAGGVGISVVPRRAALRHAQDLQIVELADEWSERGLSICFRSLGELPQAARDLIHHLREAGQRVR
ncbi:LysR substrate-binding domain-containing protein [Massilia agilis]|uniref:LysR substrate-binding domain-containing protein n=1 Tax=Massilia agilis TaxID=1811226 RepID=A0ABT2D7N3_9BURK|nr:LysR substrate-binding domain-containing protein [Massilia agilis]MCS0807316.1 LysR substrate-binding domain-containing protein [Massilia agilis]